MKNTLKMAALMLCAAIMMVSCNCKTSCKSNENKLAQFEKAATEFKATLDPSNKILGERIDTIVQKVFYLVPDPEGANANYIQDIRMHDYATNGDLSVLPQPISGIYEELPDVQLAKEMGVEFCCFNLQYRYSELIGDRLFFLIHAECSFDTETSLLYYVDVNDNSLLYVAECDEVEFDKANASMTIHKQLLKQAGEDLELTYNLSASLSDEEYAANRKENQEKEEQMVEKWREENVEE